MFARILATLLLSITFLPLFGQNQVVEFRTYELEFFKPADVLHNYFEQALIPALNRQGISNVGAFEEVGDALPKKVYLLVAHENLQAYQKSLEALGDDSQYQKDANSYLTAAPETMPYKSISTDLILSTNGFPELVKPSDDSEFFELRIYTSYNEDALRRKVKMFNDSEFGIFEDVGLPMVFFGSNIAGANMPCLTYLLAFKDKAAHGEAWTKFGPHPEWQRITKLEEYTNAMNGIIRVFLKPLSYSQL